MILQEVKIIKAKTDDGKYALRDESNLNAQIWIQPRTTSVRRHYNPKVGNFYILMVDTKDGEALPVELLEYTSHFLLEEAI